MVKVGQGGWEIGRESVLPPDRMLTIMTFPKVSHISDVSDVYTS